MRNNGLHFRGETLQNGDIVIHAEVSFKRRMTINGAAAYTERAMHTLIQGAEEQLIGELGQDIGRAIAKGLQHERENTNE